MTINGSWIHCYTPETKEQSKQWTSPGERAPKEVKTVLSAGKVMATVFWDSQGAIYVDYLEKGKMVTGFYYAELLGRFDAKLQKKQPHLAKKKVLFHHVNARLTPPPSPRPNWFNCTTNCCPIHCICQICPRATFLDVKHLYARVI